MKKKLIILAIALFMFIPSVVQALPVSTNFGVNNECKYTYDDSDGSFIIEPVNTSCTLENKGDNNEWYIRKDNIKSLVIKPGVKAPVVMDRFFEELRNIETIDVNHLDVSNTTRMFGVFIHLSQNTNGINELDLSKWNTGNVEVMSAMFGTSNIKKLKIGSYFNTSKVRSFYDMFSSSKFEELTLPFDTSSANDINLNGMFEGATYLKKLDVHTFNITNFSGIRSMFHKVGTQVKEGTEIIINDTFSNQRIFEYDFPNAFYTVNGSDPYSTTSLDSVIGRFGNTVVLIPVIPLDINKNGGDTSNTQFHGHRTGAQIDTKDIIVTKNGYKLVRWTDTQDGLNATIDIPAGGKSTNTYADFYNTQNVLMAGQKLYAQWEKDYKILEGENQTYILGSNQDVVIKANGDLADLGKIKVDEVDIDAAAYDVTSGSTVLTLKYDYLNTLSEGNHTVRFVYHDGSAKTTLRITRNTNPIDWNVTYDLNGGNAKPGFMIKPFTIYDGFEDKVPTWNDIKDILEAPKGKVYAGVEINGKKYNIGDNFKVTEDIVIKILWDDINNTGTITNNTNNPQTSDTIMFSIITLLFSSVGILFGLAYINRKKLFHKILQYKD